MPASAGMTREASMNPLLRTGLVVPPAAFVLHRLVLISSSTFMHGSPNLLYKRVNEGS
jgi:hypothetical protein